MVSSKIPQGGTRGGELSPPKIGREGRPKREGILSERKARGEQPCNSGETNRQELSLQRLRRGGKSQLKPGELKVSAQGAARWRGDSCSGRGGEKRTKQKDVGAGVIPGDRRGGRSAEEEGGSSSLGYGGGGGGGKFAKTQIATGGTGGRSKSVTTGVRNKDGGGVRGKYGVGGACFGCTLEGEGMCT